MNTRGCTSRVLNFYFQFLQMSYSRLPLLDAGSIVVGPHLYFIPQEDEYVAHGRILRYDLRKNFNSQSSWEAFDAGVMPYTAQGARGFHYATSWGPYIYFSPHYDISASPVVLRYEFSQISDQACVWSNSFRRADTTPANRSNH
jgi:hypothetical protein